MERVVARDGGCPDLGRRGAGVVDRVRAPCSTSIVARYALPDLREARTRNEHTSATMTSPRTKVRSAVSNPLLDSEPAPFQLSPIPKLLVSTDPCEPIRLPSDSHPGGSGLRQLGRKQLTLRDFRP